MITVGNYVQLVTEEPLINAYNVLIVGSVLINGEIVLVLEAIDLDLITLKNVTTTTISTHITE
jgi:hypothetical protein